MRKRIPILALALAVSLAGSGCGLVGGDDNSNENAGRAQTASDTFCDQVADGDGFVAANTFDQSDPATLRSAEAALDDLAAADSPDEVAAELEELSAELGDYRAVLARGLRDADGDEETSEAILEAQTDAEFNLADWQARLLDAENAARESCGLEDRTIETPDAGDSEPADEATTTTAG